MDFLGKALQSLPEAAQSPLAFIAYLSAIVAWLWVALRTRRLKLVLDKIKDLPPAEIPKIISKEMGEVLPKSISAEDWIRSRKHLYFLFAFLALCFLVLCIVGLASHTAIREQEKVQQLQKEAVLQERKHHEKVDALREKVDALQGKLQDELKKQVGMTVGVAEATGRANAIARSDPSNQAIKSLAEQLKNVLQEFKAQVALKDMSETDDLRIRLADATIANAERRYEAALKLVTEEEAKAAVAAVNAKAELAIAINRIRGDSLYALKRWKEALACYERILEVRPGGAFATLDVGICLFYLGRLPAALEKYNQAVDSFARLVEQDKDSQATLGLIASLGSRGLVRDQLGQPLKAILDYERALHIVTHSVEQCRKEWTNYLTLILINRGVVFINVGKMPEANQDFDKAIAILTRLIDKDGRNELTDQLAGALTNRGICLRERGRLPEALKDFDKAIATYSSLVEEHERIELASELAWSLTSRGRALEKQNKPHEALRDHDPAVAILTKLVDKEGRDEFSPALATAFTNRGFTFDKLDKLAEAKLDYDQAVTILTRLIDKGGRKELAAKLATTLKNRGGCLRKQGRLNDALGDLNQAVTILTRLVEKEGQTNETNRLASALTSRGLILDDQGKWPQALEDHDKAFGILTQLVKQESGPELLKALANLAKTLNSRGLAYMHKGDSPEAALLEYNAAIKNYTLLAEQEGRTGPDSSLARCLNNRGLSFMQADKLPEAKQDFDRAIEIRTQLVKEKEAYIEHANDLATSLSDRGALLLKQDDLPGALRDFDASVDLRTKLVEQHGRKVVVPDLAFSLTNRSLVLAKMGDLTKALQDIDKAVSLYDQVAEKEKRTNRTEDLIWSLEVRALVLADDKRFAEAIQDGEKVAILLTRLVEREQQKGLTDKLVIKLNRLAWTYATDPDGAVRDGAKGIKYAKQACQLTEWKSFNCLAALAASSAEVGDLDAAVKYQMKALEVAPEMQRLRARLQSDLKLYQDKKPCRIER